MCIGSTESLVTFKNSFRPSVLDTDLPAGTCRIVFCDEEIAGLTFLAFRRVAAMSDLPSLEGSRSTRRVVLLDSDDSEAVVRADH